MRAMRSIVSFSGLFLVAAALGLCGCGSSKKPAQTEGEGAAPDATAAATATPTAEATASAAASAAPAQDKDAPEISRSGGEEGGVVVFWPRVTPRTDDPATRELAGKVQGKLVELVKKAAPKRARDVRPEPERVCQRSGCAAMTVGVVLVSQDKGCAVVALVSGPGTAPAKLVPWAGAIELKAQEVPFREPPESEITVKDMAPCDKLLDQLSKGDAAVVKAIKDQAGS